MAQRQRPGRVLERVPFPCSCPFSAYTIVFAESDDMSVPLWIFACLSQRSLWGSSFGLSFCIEQMLQNAADGERKAVEGRSAFPIPSSRAVVP
jgi:hypothetical protein